MKSITVAVLTNKSLNVTANKGIVVHKFRVKATSKPNILLLGSATQKEFPLYQPLIRKTRQACLFQEWGPQKF